MLEWTKNQGKKEILNDVFVWVNIKDIRMVVYKETEMGEPRGRQEDGQKYNSD